MNDHYVRWFEDIRLKDVPEVGGKTASLGELYALLAADGGRVPDGFALTAEAYRDALTAILPRPMSIQVSPAVISPGKRP